LPRIDLVAAAYAKKRLFAAGADTTTSNNGAAN